jgi:hypothetical protein
LEASHRGLRLSFDVSVPGFELWPSELSFLIASNKKCERVSECAEDDKSNEEGLFGSSYLCSISSRKSVTFFDEMTLNYSGIVCRCHDNRLAIS